MKIDILQELFYLFLPWLIIFAMFWGLSRLINWARHRKAGAFVFGMMVQMFLPDPNVQQTIHMVQEVKKRTNKEHDESGDPK